MIFKKFFVWHSFCLYMGKRKTKTKQRNYRLRPNLKTIMISAFGDDSTRARAKELGAYAFLDKPFKIKNLTKTVKEILKR